MDSSVKFCGECGAALVEEAGFCGECGTASSSSQNNSQETINTSPDSEHSDSQTQSHSSTKYEKWWPKSTAGKITRLVIVFALLLFLMFFGGVSFVVPFLIIFGLAIWTISKSATKEYKEND